MYFEKKTIFQYHFGINQETKIKEYLRRTLNFDLKKYCDDIKGRFSEKFPFLFSIPDAIYNNNI